MQQLVEAKLQSIRDEDVKPYDKAFHFIPDVTYTAPMVMLLGNHSAGKSSFINYLTGREIQETGVAPTDDGFTVIRRGAFDMDDDGPTAVSSPHYQFEALMPFGPRFVNRFRIKTRRMPASSKVPENMVIVDTPGMIDAPFQVSDRSSFDGQLRGYDFLAVTRWFAQRSDVILLLFDPANPGTTGETLDVLTKSLSGMEHKFLLVLNKVDMFEKVTDFGRAYGTLCWNLSKVIKMKDIPRIYTTCTPLAPPTKATETATSTAAQTMACVPLDEVARQREEILNEVLSAPLRRLDNLITETEEGTKSLLLSLSVSRGLRRRHRQKELVLMGALGCGFVAVPALIFSLTTVSLTATIALSITAVFAGCVSLLMAQQHLRATEVKQLRAMDEVFDRLYFGRRKTKDVEMRWTNVVRPEMMRLAMSCHEEGRSGMAALPVVSNRTYQRIARVVERELPALRLQVAEHKREGYRQRAREMER